MKYWLSDYPKCPRRKGFEAELDLLKTVLGYYRRRKNPAFVTPVFEDHYLAARVDRATKKGVRSLSQEDLGRFLGALRTGRTPQYFPLALTQFCLGLRIGEAAGLAWDAIDLKNRVVRIHQIVDWDQYTWVPTIKPTTKNGQERVLVIPIVLCEELERMKHDRDPDVSQMPWTALLALLLGSGRKLQIPQPPFVIPGVLSHSVPRV